MNLSFDFLMDKRAVSPDSSTQIAEKNKKSRKRKHKHRSKKKSKKFKSSSSSQDIESDSTNTRSKSNRNADDKHLREFLDDRKELHLQLFSIISKKEVKGMMPDILKKLSFREVKHLCFEQLQLLSKRQLERIFAGKDIASPEGESDEKSEILDELETIQGQTEKEEKNSREQDEGDDTKDKRVKKRKDEEKKEKDMIIFQEMITIPKQEEIDELVEGSREVEEQTTSGPAQSADATVDEEAELKELEFRARALESLVRAREQQMKIEQR